jgi:general secretion pathway protein E
MKDDVHDTAARRSAGSGEPFLDAMDDAMLDPSLVARIPVEWARANGVLPVRWEGCVCLLMANPAEIRKIEDVALILGEDLRAVRAPAELIASAIERCYVSQRGSAEQFLKEMGEEGGGPSPSVEPRADDLLRGVEETPVTQLVNLILLEAVKARASDIHFEPFEDRLRIRYRVDGVLYEQSSPPKHLEKALVSRVKVMGRLDIAEKRLPQDGMASVRVGEREIDIRVSTIPVAEGERMVLRLLNRESSLLPLEDLGMPPAMLKVFRPLLGESHGLIIVCGPTGSGKTTTLYAAIRQLDTAGRNVLTIEDPIEYQLPDIGQMQVKPKIGLTFANGLRHILRQDPDVILVGETRDSETAEIAVRASLTGHLVFTTLHTNDAPGAVIRMMDMGVESYLVASALRATLAQRLVRRLCPACRRPAAEGTEVQSLPAGAAAGLRGRTVYQPAGCPACLGGYRGRLGIFELLVVDDALQEAIRAGAGAAKQLKAAGGGLGTLLDDGIAKIAAGETSVAEIAFALGLSGV